MTRSLLRKLTAMSFAVALTTIAGCNTMEGFGEDMSALGGAISGSAKANGADD